MIQGKKIFVTGGCGFIGSHIVKHLYQNNEITIYDNLRRNALQHFPEIDVTRIKIIQGDILDRSKLAESVKDHDIILHLAAIAGVSSYYRHPINTMRVNIQGTINLLEVLETMNFDRFINFSTSEVYGPQAGKVTEDNPTAQGTVKDARWTYSISKLAGEHLCFAYQKEKKFPVVSIRPFNIYGPGQIGEGGIQTFIPLALSHKTLHVTGDGKQIRAWCYIDDFIHAVLAAIEKENIEGETFNVGNPIETSIIDLARLIVELTESKSPIEFIPHPGTDVYLRSPDITRARQLLGYQPLVSLRDGLLKTIVWYKGQVAMNIA